MNTKKEAAGAATSETQHKDTEFSQIQICQLGFFAEPKTMMQIDRQTGIRRENVCRYVRTMKQANAIWIVRIGRCPITRHSHVKFWTTNPKFAESLPKQLTLF